MSLASAVALVTGGSGGLGSRICKLLANEDAHVAIAYLGGKDRAESVRDEILSDGKKAMTVQIDQVDPNSIEAGVARVVAEMGGLDLLVNNAAIAMGGHSVAPGDLEAFTPEIWDEMMAINVRGPFLVTRAAAAHLRSSRWGRVVNIGSTLGHGDWYQDRAFAPSKAAVVPLTRFLAASLAPDVTVNCVSPGLMVETGLGSGGSEELVQGWRDRAALGVTTSVDDVAGQVVYLCSTSTITGQSVIVDGGIHFQ
ncbi:SDR family NAD(P)-dependent oxidoreductase [Hoeflea sp.]|uniref:SDR family NAD(P)-dependent oxidoreductase n=1 Tax=Hoeflea sp. TaxID=1940281 RepID=UPI003B026AD1